MERGGGSGFIVSAQPMGVKNEGNSAAEEGREVFDIWQKLESMLLPC